MDCAHARSVIWPPDRPKLADADLIAAQEHVTGCVSCRAHFEIDRVLDEARKGLLADPPRREIRERVFQATARGRSARGIKRAKAPKRPALVAMLGGVAVAGAVFASQLVTARSPDRHLGAAFVDDYVRLAVREDHIVTSDSAEVRRFLLRELGTTIIPIYAPGLRIAGAEVCLLRGRRGAMIRYDTDTGPVSHYVIPRAGADDRPPELTSSPTGMTLVTWVTNAIEHALVGPLSPADLLAMAHLETQAP